MSLNNRRTATRSTVPTVSYGVNRSHAVYKYLANLYGKTDTRKRRRSSGSSEGEAPVDEQEEMEEM